MYYAHLTQKARYQIEQLTQEAIPVRLIARKLGVHRSTIYRERKRGACRDGRYRAHYAQLAAGRRARRSAANQPRKPATLWRWVARRLIRDWSPEQIRGRAQRLGKPTVSVPAIYAWIRRQRARGKRLYRHLRYALRRERRQLNPFPYWRKRPRPSIRQRPRQARDRREPGHWEGDTMRGSARYQRQQLLTLVERKSRYLVLRRPSLRKLLGQAIVQSTVQALRTLPARTITFDNGSEFAAYTNIEQGLGCSVFFADPRSPHQRATCENTIGLVRQYIPKGADLRQLPQHQLAAIEKRMNLRPRKCLGYLTPLEVLFDKSPDVALRA